MGLDGRVSSFFDVDVDGGGGSRADGGSMTQWLRVIQWAVGL